MQEPFSHSPTAAGQLGGARPDLIVRARGPVLHRGVTFPQGQGPNGDGDPIAGFQSATPTPDRPYYVPGAWHLTLIPEDRPCLASNLGLRAVRSVHRSRFRNYMRT